MSDYILITYYNRGTTIRPLWDIYGHRGIGDNKLLGTFPVKTICAEQAASMGDLFQCPVMMGRGSEELIKLSRERDEYDPTPWCMGCGSMTQSGCNCGPIAENN